MHTYTYLHAYNVSVYVEIYAQIYTYKFCSMFDLLASWSFKLLTYWLA